MVIQTATTDRLTPAPAVSPYTSGERTYRAVTLVAGLVVMAVGLSVMVGWQTDHFELVRLGTTGSLMVFNTALLFFAAGSALLAIAFQRFRLVHLLGALLVAVAAATALQAPLNADLGIDDLFFGYTNGEVIHADLRMSINSAICFLLIGLALAAMRSPGRQGWRFFATALLASAALAISIVAIFGHTTGLTDALGWGGTYGMSMPTAICMTISAVSLMAWAARYHTQLGNPLSKLIPLVVGNAIVIGTIGLWHAVEFQDQESIQGRVNARFDDLIRDVKYTSQHHEGVVMRMAKRWNASGGTTEANWRDDAKNYLEALKGFEALAWLDSNLEPQWVEVADDSDLVKMVANNSSLREMIHLARQEQVARAMILTSGSPPVSKVWLCEPVSKAGTDDGCLLAIFDLNRQMSQITAPRAHDRAVPDNSRSPIRTLPKPN